MHLEPARIDGIGDAADAAALAGGVVALEGADEGDVAERLPVGQIGEPPLKLVELLLVVGGCQRLAEIEGIDGGLAIEPGDDHRGGGDAGPAAGVQPRAHGREQGPADHQIAVMAIGARDNDPGRLADAGHPDAFLDRRHRQTTMLAQHPMLEDVAACRPAAFSMLRQPLLLFGRRDVQPELDEKDVLGGEHRLEPVDDRQLLFEPGVVAAAGHAVDEDVGVPGAEEDADLALRRQTEPVSPQARPRPLLVVGRIEGLVHDFVLVEPLVQPRQRLALAGAVDAGEDDEDGKVLALDQIELRIEEGSPQARFFGLERRLVDLVDLLGGLEHQGGPSFEKTRRYHDASAVHPIQMEFPPASCYGSGRFPPNKREDALNWLRAP